MDNLPALDDVLSGLKEKNPNGNSAAVLEDSDSDELLFGDPGMECDVKNVYEGPPKCDCCINWVDEYPDDLKTVVDTADSKRHALLVRNKKSHRGEKPMEISEIVVQSPLLRTFLKDALSGYPGLSFSLEEVVLKSPFAAAFHHWDKFKEAALHHPDEKILTHVRLLFGILRKELKNTFRRHKDLLLNSLITFDYLWTLFKPGELVYKPGKTSPRMYRVLRTEYDVCDDVLVFDLYCLSVDWDGDEFGSHTGWERIRSFNGPVVITDLLIYPERFVRDLDQVEGRVMIDAKAYFEYNPGKSVYLESLPYDNPSGVCAQGPDRPLTDEQLLLCTPHLKGYAFTQKSWVEFSVDNVSDISWNGDAFANLLLPRQHKELILSFVQAQIAHHDTFDDFIAGKGQGVIILLGGSPGLGKTLTAESVAEEMHAPLYSVTAGELGSGIGEIERALGRILELAERWKAVLLLDEADVFLEQRSNHEIERNKLVSVFLRTLEYYKGILFITSNRVTSIDTAFKSRIHLSLNYPSLSRASQKQIWRSLVGRSLAKTGDFTNDDWDGFTEHSMNGREIKNAVKLAHLLASRRGESLAPLHIKEVLSVLRDSAGDKGDDADHESNN
ncbi:hypothetical protein DL767_001473 [Monosporascus sp. MG133]|nr:hypothetical protein DL767_001473 [Monosporascus sp. MG133]